MILLKPTFLEFSVKSFVLRMFRSAGCFGVTLVAFCSLHEPVYADATDSDTFFLALHELCGARYEGEMTYSSESADSFAGKMLVAEIVNCDSSTVRVPFRVGEDASRTWVFSQTEQGLQLKHEHLYEDGRHHEVSNYGGVATKAESEPLSRSFPADAYTQELIPAASTNVWNVSLSEDRQQLTYYLTRHSKPRFTALLYRVK